jgi:hypothetical protein
LIKGVLKLLLNVSNFRKPTEISYNFTFRNQVILKIMKKVIFIIALMMSVVIVKAQVVPPSTTPGAGDTSSYNKAPSASTATNIQAVDLPKAVTDKINKDYPGYTIKEATSVSAKSGLEYQVEVMKGAATETLLYDKDGKFLRKVAPKTGMKHSTKK